MIGRCWGEAQGGFWREIASIVLLGLVASRRDGCMHEPHKTHIIPSLEIIRRTCVSHNEALAVRSFLGDPEESQEATHSIASPLPRMAHYPPAGATNHTLQYAHDGKNLNTHKPHKPLSSFGATTAAPRPVTKQRLITAQTAGLLLS
jgi:hypothetical protein